MFTEMVPPSYDVMFNIKAYPKAYLGGGSYHIETFQLICIMIQLNLFFMAWVLFASDFRRDYDLCMYLHRVFCFILFVYMRDA